MDTAYPQGARPAYLPFSFLLHATKDNTEDLCKGKRQGLAVGLGRDGCALSQDPLAGGRTPRGSGSEAAFRPDSVVLLAEPPVSDRGGVTG